MRAPLHIFLTLLTYDPLSEEPVRNSRLKRSPTWEAKSKPILKNTVGVLKKVLILLSRATTAGVLTIIRL